LLAPSRVEDRADIVHPGLHCWQTRCVDRVGGAPAAEIAGDQASAGGQASQTASDNRIVPEEIDRSVTSGRIQDVAIGRAVRYLVRDVITTT
jgi:hypothetical protein